MATRYYPGSGDRACSAVRHPWPGARDCSVLREKRGRDVGLGPACIRGGGPPVVRVPRCRLPAEMVRTEGCLLFGGMPFFGVYFSRSPHPAAPVLSFEGLCDSPYLRTHRAC